MENLVIFIILGLAAGVMAGMFGIGGGVIIVPILVTGAGFSLIEASGTSLAALMMPVGIFACISYYRNGFMDIKVAGVFALGLLLGVYFGAELAIILSSDLLKQLYGLFLLWVCWRFFEIKSIFRKRDENPKADEVKKSERPFTFIKLLPFGLTAGVLSGMFGIGGGLVIVPILITFMGFETKKAIGTSMGALLLPVALPGVLRYYNAGHLNIEVAAILALGLATGSIFGAKVTIRLPQKIVKRVYAVFLLLMALNFIVKVF